MSDEHNITVNNFNVTVTEFEDAQGAEKLRHIFDLLLHINRKVDTIMADLTALQAAVANETTVEQSAITLLTQLAAQIAALPADQGAIDALAKQVNDSATALAAAVSANTPAAPASGS